MLSIGITGGIGSGKSTVCKVFELLGVPVFYADQEAKRLMVSDPGLKLALMERFGADLYRPDHSIDRNELARLVFNHPEALSALNALVHPVVIHAHSLWIERLKGEGAANIAYGIKEAALIFETGTHRLLDKTIHVHCPDGLRIARIKKRENWSEEKIMARIEAQMPESEKEALADEVIMNDDIRPIIPQVIHLHRYFCSLSGLPA